MCEIVQNICKCRTFYLLLQMSTRRERAKAQNAQQKKQMPSNYEASEVSLKWKESERTLNEWKSKLLTDLAKLVFAGVILGGLFEKVENPYLLYGSGLSAIAIFLYLGYLFLRRSLK